MNDCFKTYLIDIFETTYVECLRNSMLCNLSDMLIDKLRNSKYYGLLYTNDMYIDTLCEIIKLYNVKYPEYNFNLITNLFTN